MDVRQAQFQSPPEISLWIVRRRGGGHIHVRLSRTESGTIFTPRRMTRSGPAYSACLPLPDADSRYVVCVKPRDQKFRQEINYEKIAADLNDFLTSSDRTRRLLNSERWSGYLFTYGIKCFDQMISDIKRGVTDAKSMNLFCDYVTSMECTVDEIKSSGDFDSDETYYRLKGQLVTIEKSGCEPLGYLLLKYSVKNHGDLSDSDIGALVKHYTDFRNTSEAFAKELIKALDYPVLKHSLSESEYDMANADELGLFLPETKWSDCVHKLEKRYSGSINIEFDITPLRASKSSSSSDSLRRIRAYCISMTSHSVCASGTRRDALKRMTTL